LLREKGLSLETIAKNLEKRHAQAPHPAKGGAE
jgi:phosphoribosyl-ATP pyrophosphohydrolase